MPKYSLPVMQLSAFLRANAVMPPVTGWPNSGQAQPERRVAIAW
jgi:hypothetical protein